MTHIGTDDAARVGNEIAGVMMIGDGTEIATTATTGDMLTLPENTAGGTVKFHRDTTIAETRREDVDHLADHNTTTLVF